MRILYVGGFELPDKNAAAHRVIANGKAMRELGHEVVFVGISKDASCSKNIMETKTTYFDFDCYAIPYPTSTFQWLKYITTNPFMKLVDEFKPEAIIVYNYPAVALRRLMTLCRKRHIKLIADVTEWYAPEGNILHKVIKWCDTEYRMRRLHKRLDGIIAISQYLTEYYKENKVITVPPLIDKTDAKWRHNEARHIDDTLRFVYAGTPWGGGAKDMLNKVIAFVDKINSPKRLNIIGIRKDQYLGQGNPEPPSFVTFKGRVNHATALKEVQEADFQIFIREINKVTKAGFPTKFVESLACGTPVITNRSSDLEDYMEEGIHGFWVEDDDTALIKTLESLNQIEKAELKRRCIEDRRFDYRNYKEQFQYLLS